MSSDGENNSITLPRRADGGISYSFLISKKLIKVILSVMDSKI